MKIFITGTTGFLGRSLKEHFETDHEIIEYVRGTDIFTMLEVAEPDVVINCAGEIYKTELMFESNIGIVQTILNWLKNTFLCKN